MKLFIFAFFTFTVTHVHAFGVSPGAYARQTALKMTPVDNEKSKEIRVGVIGCGRIGIVHLGAITKAPNVRPVIVSNPTLSKAEAGKVSMHIFYESSFKNNIIQIIHFYVMNIHSCCTVWRAQVYL